MFSSIVLLIVFLTFSNCKDRPLVIGHRGSGYLPELTIETQSLGFGLGADVVEIDVNLSRDNQLVVVHDLFLDAISNVREIFPHRNRSDGLNYLIDFDFFEIEKVRVHERVDPTSGDQVYPQRFPCKSQIDLKISSLNETLEFLLGFRRSTKRNFRILIELKNPEFYRSLRREISEILISTLKAFDLTKRDDPILIQSFSIDELEFIRRNLSSEIQLVALLPEKSEIEPDFFRNETRFEILSKFVDGIAPSFDLLVDFNEDGSIRDLTNLTVFARKNNLKIYPWTFRKDVFGTNFESIVKYFSRFIEVDGFIASQPDLIVQLIEKVASRSNRENRFTILTIFIVVFGFGLN